jgi:RraA family protein
MYKAIRKNPSAPQAPDDFLSALRDIPVSALSDNMHRNIGSVGLRPYQRPGRKTMAGTAITVRSRGGDNLTYLRALEFCRKGDVLVVDAGGDLDNAVVGGILSFYAAHVGMAGLVVDGAIRDVAEIRERDFPVYARGVTHRGPYKDGPGEINVTVSAGGMVVKPGDIVVGDQHGWRRGLAGAGDDRLERVELLVRRLDNFHTLSSFWGNEGLRLVLQVNGYRHFQTFWQVAVCTRWRKTA